MKASFFRLTLAVTLVASLLFSVACENDESSTPKCNFDPAGINIGYALRYYQLGGVAAGGMDVCQYAQATTWTGSDTHFPGKTEGYILKLNTYVSNQFAGCPQAWVKIYSDDDFVTGKRYDAVGWVVNGPCNSPNTTGWLELTHYDKANQSLSGRLYLGNNESKSLGLNEISNATFRNVALSN